MWNYSFDYSWYVWDYFNEVQFWGGESFGGCVLFAWKIYVLAYLITRN